MKYFMSSVLAASVFLALASPSFAQGERVQDLVEPENWLAVGSLVPLSTELVYTSNFNGVGRGYIGGEVANEAYDHLVLSGKIPTDTRRQSWEVYSEYFKCERSKGPKAITNCSFYVVPGMKGRRFLSSSDMSAPRVQELQGMSLFSEAKILDIVAPGRQAELNHLVPLETRVQYLSNYNGLGHGEFHGIDAEHAYDRLVAAGGTPYDSRRHSFEVHGEFFECERSKGPNLTTTCVFYVVSRDGVKRMSSSASAVPRDCKEVMKR